MSMRLFLMCLAAILVAGCASVDTHVVVLDPTVRYEPTKDVQVLLRAPDRPYVEIAKIEARGVVGESEPHLIESAREKAKALGADAIITLETVSTWQPPVTVWDPWPIGHPWYYDRWLRSRFWYHYGPMSPFPYPEVRVFPGGNAYTLRALAIKFK